MFGEYEETEHVASQVAAHAGDAVHAAESDALDADLITDRGPDLIEAGKGLVKKLIDKVTHAVFQTDDINNFTTEPSSDTQDVSQVIVDTG